MIARPPRTRAGHRGRALLAVAAGIVALLGLGWVVLRPGAERERSRAIAPTEAAGTSARTALPSAREPGLAGPSSSPPASTRTEPAAAPRPAREPRVVGRVRARGGEPVANARVTLALDVDGVERWVGTATSDAGGTYVLAVPPLATLALDERGRVALRGQVRAARFRPARATQVLAAAAGCEEQHLDFRVDVGQGLTGRVVDGASRAVRDADVALEVESRRGEVTTFVTVDAATTGPDGRFQLGFVSSARHRLRARREGLGTACLEPLELVAEDDRELGDLALCGPGLIAGALTYPDGEPATDVELWAVDATTARDRESITRATRAAADAERGEGLAWSRLHTDGAGHFRCAGLRGGAFTIVAADPRAAVECMPPAVESLPVSPAGAATSNALACVLRATRIVARVEDEDGRALPRAGVILTRVVVDQGISRAAGEPRSAEVSGPRSSAAFVVEPGATYVLQAFAGRARGAEVQVDFEVGRAQREVLLVVPRSVPEGRLRLRVDGADGERLTDLRVALVSPLTGRRVAEFDALEADADGLLPPIRAGRYALVVDFGPGAAREHLPITVDEPVTIEALETREITLSAARGARLEVALRWRGAAPAEFERLRAEFARDPAAHAARLAQEFGVVLVLRSADGRVRRLSFVVGAETRGWLVPGEIATSAALVPAGEYEIAVEGTRFRAPISPLRARAGEVVHAVLDVSLD